MPGIDGIAYPLPYTEELVTLGALELTSIALGFSAADSMVKEAPVTVIDAAAVCPGKYIIFITGGLSGVESAMKAGMNAAGKSCTGHFIIPNLSPEILPGINRVVNRTISGEITEAVGIVETFSAASGIFAADASVKASGVTVESISLLNGLGGKAYYLVSGKTEAVESALDAASAAIEPRDLADRVLIPRLHPDIIRFFPGKRKD
ncbi:MAG: BMC domain-containing protein [Spirochaetia bacterium]